MTGRLFKIVYHLLDKGQATASELAEKLEVSVRTIYRDIDALSEAGVPVYAEAGRKGGIRLMEHFTLDRAVLSEEEKREILTALQSLGAAGNVYGGDTLQKLSALFHLERENWLEVDFSRWGSKEQDNEKFEQLKDAVIHRRSVKIRYAGSGGRISGRVVWPLKLSYREKFWYLKAFCTSRQDYRMFKLNRILELDVLDENFSCGPFPEEADEGEEEYNTIILRFPKKAAYRVYDEFDASQVEVQENGDFIVSVRMPEDEWLTGFLLSFGTQVEIVEPVYLREVVAEQAALTYKKYLKNRKT